MRFLVLAVALLVVISHAGCGGRGALKPESSATPILADTAMFPVGETEPVVISKQGFSLEVLAESFSLGGSANFGLEVSRSTGVTEAIVTAQAAGLKACYLTLEYDTQKLHPVDSDTGSWPGLSSEHLLSLTVLDAPGAVHHGAVVARPQVADGVSGSYAPLRVRFADGPAAPRQAAVVPDAEESRVADLRIDRSTGETSFSYVNLGDYDQNGEVNIADLTPLGVHFGELSPLSPAPFPFETIGSVVDGNSNGEIEIADITPIGQHFLKQVTQWRVYGGVAIDYPFTASEGNGASALLGTIAFDASMTLPSEARLAYSATIADLITFSGEMVWLRPVGDEDDEGISSVWFAYDPTFDMIPPVWSYPESVGVVGLIPLDGAVRVLWGEAVDWESPPVTYTVYYNEGDFVDFEDASSVTLVASDPPDPGLDQFLEVGGLANGTTYAFAVRAQDAATIPNEEGNFVMLATTPLAEQELPATISGSMTFDGPMRVGAGNTVTATGGEAITFLSDLTIEEGATLRGLNDDLLLIVEGDFVLDGNLELDLPDEPLPAGQEDVESLMVVCRGAYTSGANSVVSTEGNLYLVDEESLLIPPAEVVAATVQSPDPEEYPFNIMGGAHEEPPAEASTIRTVSEPKPRGGPARNTVLSGEWKAGKHKTRAKRLVTKFRVKARKNLIVEDFSVQGPILKAPPDKHATACEVVGTNGKDLEKWHVLIQTRGTIEVRGGGMTFDCGAAADGGYALIENRDCKVAKATGGNAGSVKNCSFRWSAGKPLTLKGPLQVLAPRGGTGGEAEARGWNAPDHALPDGRKGGDALAIGGKGGDCLGFRLAVAGIDKQGGGSFAVKRTWLDDSSGTGGFAKAVGGKGGKSTSKTSPTGGFGGKGTAIGGPGGHMTCVLCIIPSTVEYEGAYGGTGGNGEAFGGEGGQGFDCGNPGGKGGTGGDATAHGGKGGNAEAPAGVTALAGDGGERNAWGGKGGKGGNCLKGQGGPGGSPGKVFGTHGSPGDKGSNGSPGLCKLSGGWGGDGGDGLQPGDPADGDDPGPPDCEQQGGWTNPGHDGKPGKNTTEDLSKDRAAMSDDLEDPSGDLIDYFGPGTYTVGLYDMKSGHGQVGEVDVEFLSEGEWFELVNLAQVTGNPEDPYVIRMPPGTSIALKRSNVSFWNPDHDKSWVGFGLTIYQNEIELGGMLAELLFEGVPVGEAFAIPIVDSEASAVDKYIEFFPDPTGAEWDELWIIRVDTSGALFDLIDCDARDP